MTEIADEELGVAYPGPVGRLMGAGASTYLPPGSIPDVVAGVRAHVERPPQRGLEGVAGTGPSLSATVDRPGDDGSRRALPER